MITYNILSKISEFFSVYGQVIGGGGVSLKKRELGNKFNKDFYKNLQEMDGLLGSNLGNLSPEFLKNYKVTKQQMSNHF